MIESYTDHAANERTYLAWVRTALAFMAFGLLIERFDLFVRRVPSSSPVDAAARQAQFVEVAGLLLILFGILMLAVSSWRYLRFKSYIASPEKRDFASSRSDVVLLVIVGIIGLCMSVYVVIQAFN